MKVHTYEKAFLAVGATTLVVCALALAYATFGMGVHLPGRAGAVDPATVRRTPPFDHPHVYLDMGDADEIICPYCSTLYRLDHSLNSHAARPAECELPLTAAA